MTGENRALFLGIFWAVVSVIGWSTLFPAVAFLMGRGNIDSYSLTATRYLVAAVVMLGGMMLFCRRSPVRGIALRDWCDLVIHGVFIASMGVLLFCAQRTLPVVNASMLEAEAPLLMFVLGLFLLGNRASMLQLGGLLLGLVGCMLVLNAADRNGFHLTSLSFGDFLVFLAALCWALYTVLARKTIGRIGGFLYTSWSVLFGGCWVLVYLAFHTSQMRLPTQWPDLLGAVYLGLVPTALAFFAWNNAQRYISIGLLAVSGYFTPMLSTLLAMVIFQQPITLFQVGGMILVFGSALIEPEIAARIIEWWKTRIVPHCVKTGRNRI